MLWSLARLAKTASVSRTSEQMPAKADSDRLSSLELRTIRGTVGRYVAFQQLPVALGKRCSPRVYNKPKNTMH